MTITVARGALLLAIAVAILSACSLVRDLDDLEPRAGDASAPSGACPVGMIELHHPDGAGFCIDATEVTQAAYATFLAGPSPQAPSGCAGANRSLDPDEPGADCAGNFDPRGRGTFPVTCIDFCDAATYCAARGARLCGGRGGAVLEDGGVNDPATDEWLVACGVERAFAPGADASGCVSDQKRVVPVTQAGCATPEGVLHLSGNVSEWTNACRNNGARRQCLARGGDFNDPVESLRCKRPESASAEAHPTGFRAIGLGFRCCKDVPR